MGYQSSRKNNSLRESVKFLILVLSVFAGVLVYGEKRLEDVEASARAEIRIETQQRREDIKEVQFKLDKILEILTRSR